MSCVLVLQRGHSGDGCDLASTLCKYDLRKGDLFVLSWARVRCGSISSELLMYGGGVRSVLLLPIVARCLETIDVPYILGYKSHFFYLKIGSKIHCVLYVGNTKRETIFLLSKIKKIPVSIVFHRYPWFSIASVQSNSVRMLIIIICGFHSRQYKLT